MEFSTMSLESMLLKEECNALHSERAKGNERSVNVHGLAEAPDSSTLPYIYIYTYTGKPPPGSRNQWFIDRLVNGSILDCWLQVADYLVTYWLPGCNLVTGSRSIAHLFADSDEVSRFL